MRSEGLYPVLRQSSFAEWHEATHEANAQLVRTADLLPLPSTDGEAAPPPPAEKPTPVVEEEEEEGRFEEVDD